MKIRRMTLVDCLLVVLAFLFAAWMYPRLPPIVPVHWGFHDQVNGTMPKPWGVFFLPLLMVAVWGLLEILPGLSPQGFRIDGFLTVYDILKTVILGFMLLLTGGTLVAGAGYRFPVGPFVTVSIGILLVILGNYMGKLRRNFFIGIRTPWTLADHEVWLRTHRAGGWIFVTGGFAVIVAGLLGAPPGVFLGLVLVTTLVPIALSFVIYRRLHPSHAGDDTED